MKGLEEGGSCTGRLRETTRQFRDTVYIAAARHVRIPETPDDHRRVPVLSPITAPPRAIVPRPRLSPDGPFREPGSCQSRYIESAAVLSRLTLRPHDCEEFRGLLWNRA